MYALLPTIIIILLGFLLSNVTKLASAQEARWNKQKEFECFCGGKFPSKASLDAHMKAHANEVRKERDNGTIENEFGALKYLKDKYEGKDVPTVQTLKKWLS